MHITDWEWYVCVMHFLSKFMVIEWMCSVIFVAICTNFLKQMNKYEFLIQHEYYMVIFYRVSNRIEEMMHKELEI